MARPSHHAATVRVAFGRGGRRARPKLFTARAFRRDFESTAIIDTAIRLWQSFRRSIADVCRLRMSRRLGILERLPRAQFVGGGKTPGTNLSRCLRHAKSRRFIKNSGFHRTWSEASSFGSFARLKILRSRPWQGSCKTGGPMNRLPLKWICWDHTAATQPRTNRALRRCESGVKTQRWRRGTERIGLMIGRRGRTHTKRGWRFANLCS